MTILTNPTQADLHRALGDTVYDILRLSLEGGRAGHCLRISALPEVVMRDLCARFNAEGVSADVVMLVGPRQTVQYPWQVTATRLIELRNAEQRPLLACIPPGLKAAAEDSFDVSTFREIDLKDVPRRLRHQLLAKLPDDVGRLAEERVVRYLERVERLVSADDIWRYYLTILQNGGTKQAAGGALYQLKLVPDFELLATSDRIEQRLDRNAAARRTLLESNQPLLGRIHELALEEGEFQARFYRFLQGRNVSDVAAWGAVIATDPSYAEFAFDRWPFKGEALDRDDVCLFVDDLNLTPRDKGQPPGPDNPLYLDVKRANSVKIQWETNPKPAAARNLAYFRIEIVSADGAVAWESKNIPKGSGSSASRSKSLKVAEFRDQVQDGLYFFRVRAYSDTGDMVNDEDPEHPVVLRDKQNPEGKRINESEDVWFWVDEDAPPPAEPQRNVTVQSFLDAQLQVQFAALDRGDDPFGDRLTPRTDKTGWATVKGSRAEAIYNIVYDAQTRFSLPVSNLLRTIESETLAHPETLGRWRLNFADHESNTAQPMVRQYRDVGQIPSVFRQARRAVFDAIRGSGGDITATVDLTRHSDLILAYARAYDEWLSEVQVNFSDLAVRQEDGRRRTDAIFLDIDTVEVILRNGSAQTDRVYLLAPTHPVRLLWHLQRARMSQAWLQEAVSAGTRELLTRAVRSYLQNGLAPVNLPPLLRSAHEAFPEALSRFYVEQGPLTLFWSLYVREDVEDSRSLRARVRRTLGIGRSSASAAVTGGIGANTLIQKLRRYLGQHPYVKVLKLNVFNPGDAALVVDAILGVEKERVENSLPALHYDLRLFTHQPRIEDVGEAVDELLNPQRQVSAEADAFTVASRNHLFPKLRFSRNLLADFLADAPRYEAHISILHDVFPVDVETERRQPGRSSFAYGLIQEQVTHFVGADTFYAWQRQLVPNACRELPDGEPVSAALAAMLERIAALQASVAVGQGKYVENYVPTIQLKLETLDKNLLNQIHAVSDWVFIIDRHLGLEYFDSDVGDDRPVYLLDFTPEFAGSDTDRLLLTTRAVDEIIQLIHPVLDDFDLLSGEGVEMYFLHLLRSLSGRLALKLVSSPTQVSEAVGLALARLFLEQYGLLEDRIVIPLDAHAGLFAATDQGAAEDEVSWQRGDLLLVACNPDTRELRFHIVEVKLRADLRDFSAYAGLRQQIEGQLTKSDTALRQHFDLAARPVDRIDRQIKTKELISLLNFYLARSRRYGLVSESAYNRLRPFIESLDSKYQLSCAGVGLVFDLDHEGLTTDEEHAGLVYHRVGSDYVRRLLDNGLRRRARLQEEAAQRPASIEETEAQIVEQQRIVRDTSMSGDDSYPRVRSPFDLSKPITQKIAASDKPVTAAQPGVATVAQQTDGPPLPKQEVPANSSQPSPQPPSAPPSPAVSRVDGPASSPPPPLDDAPPPATDVWLGDTVASSQFGVLGRATGKIVSLDLNGTNTISLFGVQGGGKSYTVGSIVEMATQAFPHINHLPSPLASVIFHYHESQDYAPEFVSMIAANDQEAEARALAQGYGAAPAGLHDVLVLTSADKLAERRAEFPGVQVEPIAFSSAELSFKDWRFLMGVAGNQMYMKQINLIMRQLRERMTLDTLRHEIEMSDLSDSQKSIARIRLDFAAQFIDDNRRLADLLRPGRLVIVDLRDEFIDKDEALGLFVVMLNIFANAGRGQDFNKLIVFDEAHKYMDNPDLTGHIVDVIRQMRHQGVSVLIASQDPPSLPNAIIELSSLVILHRFNSPQWLKHVQRSITALSDLTPAGLASLRPGEAFVWATKATERMFTQKAVKIQFRPRVTRHGGGTKTAV